MEISETNSGKHKHVRKMQGTDVYKAMRVLAQYCEDHHSHCYDCMIADYGLCDGGFPIKYSIKDIEDMPKWTPVEDKTGEGSNTYKCPVCWETQQIEDGTPEENGWIYCPHCGVRLVHEE